MPWGRIDENAMEHPKFVALSDGAWRLWCQGMLYCQRHLTNGFIPDESLHQFRHYSTKRHAMLTSVLVKGKQALWHEVDGGVQLHDYLHHNDSRAKVLRERRQAKKRLQKFRSKHRNGNGVSSDSETAFATRSKRTSRNGAPRHDTTHPDTGRSKDQNDTCRSARYHAFCGTHFHVSHKQLDVVLKTLGDKAYLWNAEWLLQWDTAEPEGDLLDWLKEKAIGAVKAEEFQRMGGHREPFIPGWRDECERFHHGSCASPTRHALLMLRHSSAEVTT